MATGHTPPAHTGPVRTPQLPVDLPTAAVTLAGAVDIALQATPETRVAWAQAREAAALYGVSRSAWYPQLTAYVDAAYDRDLFPFGGSDNIIRLDELDRTLSCWSCGFGGYLFVDCDRLG